MIIPPMILPQIPDPSVADCEMLLSYADSVICGLESVLDRLYGVSAYPDEAMMLIRDKVETMLSEAKAMRSDLNLIKTGAADKTGFCNQSQTMA